MILRVASGIHSQETVIHVIADVENFKIYWESKHSYCLAPYNEKTINVRTDIIDTQALQFKNPHPASLNTEPYNDSNVELHLGQYSFKAIQPLENFKANSKNSVSLP